jgi:hypothetical protein
MPKLRTKLPKHEGTQLPEHGETHAYEGTDPIPDHSIDPRQIKALGVFNTILVLPQVGTGGQYGRAFWVIPMDSEKSLVPLAAKFTVFGTFQTNETVTIRITAVYNDGTTNSITISVTTPGTITLNTADLADLYSYTRYIKRMEVAAASSASTTLVGIRGVGYGKHVFPRLLRACGLASHERIYQLLSHVRGYVGV